MSVETYKSKFRISGHSLVITVPHEIVKEMELGDGDPALWAMHDGILTVSFVRLKDVFRNVKVPGDKEVANIKKEIKEDVEELKREMR